MRLHLVAPCFLRQSAVYRARLAGFFEGAEPFVDAMKIIKDIGEIVLGIGGDPRRRP